MFIVAWSKGEKFSPPLSDPAFGPYLMFTLPPKNSLEHPHSLPFVYFQAELLTVKPGIRKIKIKKSTDCCHCCELVAARVEATADKTVGVNEVE